MDSQLELPFSVDKLIALCMLLGSLSFKFCSCLLLTVFPSLHCFLSKSNLFNFHGVRILVGLFHDESRITQLTMTPNFYKSDFTFRSGQEKTLLLSTSLPHASQLSERALHTFTPTCLAVVKMNSPTFYKPPTHFTVVKTDSLYFY